MVDKSLVLQWKVLSVKWLLTLFGLGEGSLGTPLKFQEPFKIAQ